jgi:hypothetical protein
MFFRTMVVLEVLFVPSPSLFPNTATSFFKIFLVVQIVQRVDRVVLFARWNH